MDERKIHHTKVSIKMTGITILVVDKTQFQTKCIIMDKEEHFILTKGSV